eukprot:TRINITY_DN52624_c0_g1_i1.p1 TRINITY_DN52624_c0_g1~~TRINITY_DN52624_c0_g1_i1.p1  ORF type:complete len:520 (+),score=81.06 TRINITY_DN52624_c0_g1_i1:46-1605(+)
MARAALLSLCLHQVTGDAPVQEPQKKAFIFGTASAAWQYEGAVRTAGRGPTIWDAYCHTPGKCYKNQSADVAVDQYNLTRLEGDIKLMKELGTTAYRLSISWTRLLPEGTGRVEERGLEHSRKVFSMLRQAGVEPWVTLFHFDLPLALEHQGGWLNASIADAFAQYAALCFEAFGRDLVKHWFTINEPHTIATAGYLYGVAAPGRCSNRSLCVAGNGTIEPYVAAHNMLRAHAKAVEAHRSRKLAGTIDIVISADWTEPYDEKAADDQLAAERRQEFQVGWFADPIWYGDYPASMRSLVGERLPRFSDSERKALKGSYSLFALNHYTSRYAKALPLKPASTSAGWDDDQCLIDTPLRGGEAIGPVAGSDWLYSVPWGLRKLLGWISRKYESPPIFITENGCDDAPLDDALEDRFRIQYFDGYLHSVRQAIELDGVDVRSYFAWSLLDNFEWGDGESKRFGLYHVDYDNDLKRIPKASVNWFVNMTRNWPGHHTGGMSAPAPSASTAWSLSASSAMSIYT